MQLRSQVVPFASHTLDKPVAAAGGVITTGRDLPISLGSKRVIWFEKGQRPAAAAARTGQRSESEQPGQDATAHLGLRTRARRLSPPAQRDDQNDPHADIADAATVLERNIVNLVRRHTSTISKHERCGVVNCNRAAEQSLAARLPLLFRADPGAVESLRVAVPETGTNGEEKWGVKLYARLKTFLAQKKVRRATFTESYAVLEKIMDGTPGKGDGS